MPIDLVTQEQITEAKNARPVDEPVERFGYSAMLRSLSYFL